MTIYSRLASTATGVPCEGCKNQPHAGTAALPAAKKLTPHITINNNGYSDYKIWNNKK